MVNINISIPDDLHKRVKLVAVMREQTIKDFITARLDEGLRRRGR